MEQTREEVLKDYPHIPYDCDLGDFLFFMGRSIVL